MLEVSDAFDIALQMSRESAKKDASGEITKLVDGIEMTYKLFHKVLDEVGVKKYDSLGQKIDPHLHFVNAQVHDPAHEPGVITYVIKEGYTIHDRVLRPAQVIISADVDTISP
uniref:GrpE, mitochondrial n=1 Tax=Lygus hesperus TaxID=30085 RepID=A0A0A9YPY3_LYGHE